MIDVAFWLFLNARLFIIFDAIYRDSVTAISFHAIYEFDKLRHDNTCYRAGYKQNFILFGQLLQAFPSLVILIAAVNWRHSIGALLLFV
jgi:hypothetical protein